MSNVMSKPKLEVVTRVFVEVDEYGNGGTRWLLFDSLSADLQERVKFHVESESARVPRDLERDLRSELDISGSAIETVSIRGGHGLFEDGVWEVFDSREAAERAAEGE